MVTAYQAAVGGIAVVLGVAWIVDPIRMSRYQNKFRVFKRDEEEFEENDSLARAGRVGGVILAVVGAAFATGVIP